MPIAPFRQTNFGGGYLSPQLYGRTDHAKYQAGVAEARNCTVQRFSGLENRAGLRYCVSTIAGLFQGIPFITSAAVSYSLELGAGYIRPLKNGNPISVLGTTLWQNGVYFPPGQICTAAFGTQAWYPLAECWQGAPTSLTISGASYAAGAQLTITASAATWTADMAQTGAVIKVQVPGGQIVTITLNAYTSSTVVGGTADIAIPGYLQALATVFWIATAQVFGLNYLGSNAHPSASTPITISIGATPPASTMHAGQTLTLVSNVGFFSNEMVAGSQVFTFPTANGPLRITIIGYTDDEHVFGVANIDVPAALQNAATIYWSNPNTLSFSTFSPLGPDMGHSFPPNTPTLTLTTATNFGIGASVVVTASANVFSAPMVGQILVLHDINGAIVTLGIASYTSATQVVATPQVVIPVDMQNAPIVAWSTPNVAPAAGPLWSQLGALEVRIPTQMTAAAIESVWYAQSTDILTLTHQSFAPFQLLHYSDTRWKLQDYIPGPSILPPAGLNVQVGFGPPEGSSFHTFAYVVTAIDATTGEESLASNPVSCIGNLPASTLPNNLSWKAVANAASYNVYSVSGGVPGLIGSVNPANGLFFLDIGNIADLADQPPALLPLFQTVNDYPAICSYFQQRLGFANTPNQPQTLWFSRIGRLSNMCQSTPLVDSDAMQETIAGVEVQPIEAMVDLQKLIIHTRNAEYVCGGNAFGSISPVSGLTANRSSTCGAAAVRPIAIGITDLFVQARGTQLRDLKFDIRSYCYASEDMTIFCPDLFVGRTVIGMAYQQVPNSIVWLVLSDGSLLSFTYIRDQGLWAWATHDTGQGDIVTQVWVVQEGVEDVVYAGVNRLVNGSSVSYIERLAQRDFVDTSWLTDAAFADSYTLFDGRNATATTLTLTSQTGGWTPNDVFTLTASAPLFAATDAADGNAQGVANSFILRQLNLLGIDTSRLYFVVLAYTNSTHITVGTNAAVPTWAQGVAMTTWGKAIHAFTGLDHLDGRAVSILADGNVLASPLSPDPVFSGNPVVVVAGAIVTPGTQPGVDPNSVNGMVVLVGLPVIAEVTMLPVENEKGPSILGKQKAIKELSPTFYRSRGGWYGQLNELGQPTELGSWKQRQDELLASPTALFNGTIRLDNIQANWGGRGVGTGQAVIQQPDPLPFGLAALGQLVEVGM